MAETVDMTTIGNKIIHQLKRLQFGKKAQLAFLEDFYLLVNDGIPANRAIEMMAQATTGITRDVALSIAQKISEGQLLADGMRDWFTVSIVEIIRVGEEGGALTETLRSAIKTLGQQSGATAAVVSAVTYPLIVIAMACGIIVYLNNGVFMEFQTIKPMDQWPEAGRDLVTLAQLIQYWWWLVIAAVIAIILLFRRLMSNYVGELRPVLDKFPPFNLYRRFAAARLMETLGLLVANGVVFKNAIKVMQYQATPYIASHLMMMEHLMAMGRGNIADVLSTGLIDEKSILRLRVMAEVKGFEHGLVRMGVLGGEQSLKTLALVAKLLGGALLLLGGVMIIIIIRGIYLTGMAMGQ
ncbi:MAG TPA: type II secretion system F family protein [Gammaproteobacteria bacterium]|nr:type II secretion system F family protein [Gammaproteobacteria bacterium]